MQFVQSTDEILRNNKNQGIRFWSKPWSSSILPEQILDLEVTSTNLRMERQLPPSCSSSWFCRNTFLEALWGTLQDKETKHSSGSERCSRDHESHLTFQDFWDVRTFFTIGKSCYSDRLTEEIHPYVFVSLGQILEPLRQHRIFKSSQQTPAKKNCQKWKCHAAAEPLQQRLHSSWLLSFFWFSTERKCHYSLSVVVLYEHIFCAVQGAFKHLHWNMLKEDRCDFLGCNEDPQKCWTATKQNPEIHHKVQVLRCRRALQGGGNIHWGWTTSHLCVCMGGE